MAAPKCTAVKAWLIGLRSLQVVFILVDIVVLAMAFSAVMNPQQRQLTAGKIAILLLALVSRLLAFAMSATWLVLTLAPARRANACCFKSTTSCTFRYDVSSDTQFAVQYGLTVIAWAVMMLYGTGPGALGVILSAVIMALLIATAVLSSKMGRASAQEQEAPGRSGFDASTNPNVAPGTATASLYGCSAAPSKVVEVVAPGTATASMYFGSAAPPKVMEIV